MSLEDEFSDIIKKARTGQLRSVADVSRASGLAESEITQLERGHVPRHRDQVSAMANALGLRPGPLGQIASGAWEPYAVKNVHGLETIRGSIGGYEVKGYVLHDGAEAVMIDTGYNPQAMLEMLTRRGLRLRAICLTHGHTDHAEGIQAILDQHPVPVYLGPGDRDLLNWTPPDDRLLAPQDGDTIRAGGLTIRFIETPGHTPGGVCYRVEAGAEAMCFVGDTLFAGSIGRSNPATLYGTHLESVRQRVLKLPDEVVLFPGHGPATTVQQELAHNPFSLPT
ncbi:MAG: MBL fold metallo-hydrolase [Nitrospiraceae bacterium]